MYRIFFIFALIALLAATSTAAVGSVRDAETVRRALEGRYRNARTLSAAFFERYSDGNGGVAAESGTVYFSRPGRMRWDYTSPENKLFLVDGANAWFYVPADHTASRAKMKESSDWRTPLALLAGKTDLGKLCSKIDLADGKDPDAQPAADGNSVLRCTPRVETDDKSVPPDVLIEVTPEGWIARIVLHDPGNAQTEFKFGNWQANAAIPEVQFHFQPPPGVAVVDEESLAGEIH
jgi:outer membrane lipoprotein carrier protein